MERGDWPRAVQLLTESQRLEPAAGTLLNLAIAEQRLGKLASAWEHARSALDQLSPSDDRRPTARELFDSLDKRLPRLVLHAAATLDASARVRLDGLELRSAVLGVPLPVDPGAHRVEVTMIGHAPHAITVRAGEGQRIEEVLEPGDRLSQGGAQPGGRASSNEFPWRTAGWVGVGVGAACLTAGGITGYFAMRRNSTVEDHCQGQYCDSTGTEAASQGRTFATTSTVTVITGAALAAAGTLLIVFASPHKATSTAPASGWISPTEFRF